jgi:hypothetical protein
MIASVEGRRGGEDGQWIDDHADGAAVCVAGGVAAEMITGPAPMIMVHPSPSLVRSHRRGRSNAGLRPLQTRGRFEAGALLCDVKRGAGLNGDFVAGLRGGAGAFGATPVGARRPADDTVLAGISETLIAGTAAPDTIMIMSVPHHKTLLRSSLTWSPLTCTGVRAPPRTGVGGARTKVQRTALTDRSRRCGVDSHR